MKRLAFALAGFAAMGAFTLGAADAQVRGGAAKGPRGAAAGQVHDVTGPRGGKVVGGRGIAVDAEGRGITGSAGCAKGPQGATGCRAGATVKKADGTIAHKSGLAVEGAEGRTLTSSGKATKSPEGEINQSRSTTASGEKGSVSVNGSYNSETGKTRTVTCTDASGTVVACPQR